MDDKEKMEWLRATWTEAHRRFPDGKDRNGKVTTVLSQLLRSAFIEGASFEKGLGLTVDSLEPYRKKTAETGANIVPFPKPFEW